MTFWAKLVIGVLVLAYVIAFIALNDHHVVIDFVFFSVHSQLWVGFIVCVVLGAGLGAAFSAYRRHTAHSKKAAAG